MLSDTDFIKFRDYLDIKKTSESSFSVKTKGKVSNYKGEKTALYIVPILDELFQYNTYEYLFNVVKEKNINREDISFEEFLEVIGILIKGEFIETYNSEANTNQVASRFGFYGYSYDFYKKYLKNKRIAVINFTYEMDIEPLINEAKNLSLKEIKLVNFCNEAFNINTRFNNVENIIIENKHYSNIDSYFENFTDSLDLVILYSSENNYKTISKINKKLIDQDIPFINCITNDFQVSIGPLTVPHKTSCPECNKSLEKNTSSPDECGEIFKSYKVNRRAMSLISAGFLIDEVTKYLTMDVFLNPPLTLEHKLVISGLDFEYKMEEYVQNPLCTACRECNKNKLKRGN